MFELAEIETLSKELDFHSREFGAFHPQTVATAHQLALVTWRSGDVQRAVRLLDVALNGLATSLDPTHSVRMDLLGTLADIFAEQGHWEPASTIYHEILDRRIATSGVSHSKTISAKGDLAIALFELGHKDQASRLESQAMEEARTHLGETHPVTTVLAWNRALRYESEGSEDIVQSIFRKDLSWLLFHELDDLSPDQQNIRTMLAKRWSLNSQLVSSTCPLFS